MADASLPSRYGQTPTGKEVMGWVLRGEVGLAALTGARLPGVASLR